jgi:galactose mutarotase-like enzyme
MATPLVISLRNDHLAVQLIPAEGGRISSIRSHATGLEFLTQSKRTGPYPQPSLTTPFQDGPCAGVEECLPTVGPGSPLSGYVPDHGDFWQLPWRVLANSGDRLQVFADGFSRTLRFTKDLSLEGTALRVQYRVENTGSAPQSFLYACHPLFAVSAGDRILLPPEVQELTLQYSRDDRIGYSGALVSWPIAPSGFHLDVTEGPEAGTAEMFYTARLSEGICAIRREATGQMLQVSFDTSALPFLGIWICSGGWPDQGEGPRQYAVALEPTTSACNTLAEAEQQGSAINLAPGAVFEWQIRFEVITDAPQSRLPI